ncbi:MAG: methylenetetrahydrofolate--tRNA-(uracil(54)-C(5))-methyltransferase (FADH(2)-oxidizing) TrmFO [Deltaproteobacteria bacterium]|nr:methylenetetrahydrofolate--tRNA-(uracil(54)-C(5))-methyltransferase (FADH(2)-oxidizing) TrmFO [Deltaproteobacteria bacterium]
MSSREVLVVGGGLAGCEAAHHLAARGVRVQLLEMKPRARTPAHSVDELGELVCSNSLGNDRPTTAAGLLKAELRMAGSLVMGCADACTVPAGGALAVDRTQFARRITEAIRTSEMIEVLEAEVDAVPEGPAVIVATGPMTAPPLSVDLLGALGGDGDGLHYWDAISPIVEAESVDPGASFSANRWDRGESPEGDYVNCPMDEDGYAGFVQALLEAEKVPLTDFEEPRYYEGCLPIEVLAERGRNTLAFGPLKPAGLKDPRTGSRPYAVLQLRHEDRQGEALNLVGCQTRMTRPEQKRVFRAIPALRQARFLRYGQIHRNTFVDGPSLLDAFMESRAREGLFVTGQLCGVEGYLESTAAGLLTALAVARKLEGGDPLEMPPATTACGGLMRHVQGHFGAPFQPSGINWALVQMPPRRKGQRKHEQREEAFRQGSDAFGAWMDDENIRLI